MRCPYCGAETHGNICEYCDSELTEFTSNNIAGEVRTVGSNAVYQQPDSQPFSEILSSASYVDEEYSDKKKTTALLLCIFLGWLGIHNFYTGKWIWGIVYLLTHGLWGVGVLVDIIMIATDKYKDKNKKKLLK